MLCPGLDGPFVLCAGTERQMMQGRSLAPSWTSDGEFANRLLPGRTLLEESNDLQLPQVQVNQCLSVQPEIGAMSQWGQLWNKHRLLY